jgi:hypothetical protein
MMKCQRCKGRVFIDRVFSQKLHIELFCILCGKRWMINKELNAFAKWLDQNDREHAKKLLYFFLNGKIHKVIRTSKARDELVAWCYPDKKRVMYAYSQVKKNMGNAYSIKNVCEILNRHRVTVEEYILQGKIKEPQRVYPISNPDSTWYKFMFSESDIYDLHQFILDAGYTKDFPSKAELTALLKHNLILYTKTDEGSFVPVWKAE